jgi:hypothetical protein
MPITAKDAKSKAREKGDRSLWQKLAGFHPVHETSCINHALVSTMGISTLGHAVDAPSTDAVETEMMATKAVLVLFVHRSLMESNATSVVDWSHSHSAVAMQTLLYFLLECAGVRILPDCSPREDEEDSDDENGGRKNKNAPKRAEIKFSCFDDENGVATTEVYMEAVYGDETVQGAFLGWRWWFIACAPRFFWGAAIRERLQLNMTRYLKVLRGKVPNDMPHQSVINVDDVARLFSVYLGDKLAGGKQRELAAAIAGTGTREDGISLDDPSCVANPPLAIFTLKNASTNLNRFNLEAVAESAQVQPDHRQCSESTYFHYGNNTRTVRIRFPRPDQVWRVCEENWNVESLKGRFLPSFQDERMRLLGRGLANGTIQIAVEQYDENTISDAADALANMDLRHDDSVDIFFSDERDKHHDDMAHIFTTRKGLASRARQTRAQQLEARNALLGQRRVNAETWAVIDKKNSSFEKYKAELEAYKSVALDEFQTNILIRDHELLSDADRSVVNWFLDHKRSHRTKNAPFYLANMKTFDHSLSPEADWMTQRILEHEVMGIATMHKHVEIAYTAQFDAFRFGNNLHMNIVTTGKFGVGKSKLQEILEERHIVGVSVQATHKTKLADMVEKDTDSQITFFEELPSHLISTGVPGQADTGDPTYKARLTKPICAIQYFASDDVTGERTCVTVYSSHQGASIAATNEDWNNMAKSVRSRHMRIAMPEQPRPGSEPYKRNVHIGTGTKTRKIEALSIGRGKLEMFLVWLVERLIMCHVIRDVELGYFQFVIDEYYKRLEAAGVKTGRGRDRRRVELLARTLTIRFAVYSLCFSESAPLNQADQFTFDLKHFVTLIELQLVCTHDLVNMAIEMGIDQFIDPHRVPIMRTFASICNYRLNLTKDELDEERVAATSANGRRSHTVVNPQHAHMQGIAAAKKAAQQKLADAEMANVSANIFEVDDDDDSDEDFDEDIDGDASGQDFAAAAAAAAAPTQIPTSNANARPMQRISRVFEETPATLYRTVLEPGGEKIDYDYIRIKGKLSAVAKIIQLNCGQSVKPSLVDIQFVLRQMTEAMITVFPRDSHRQNRANAKKVNIQMAIINDDSHDPSVFLAAATLDTIRTDILSGVIAAYTTPCMGTWDSIKFVPTDRMPFIMPRRHITSCTQEEYDASDSMALIFNNPNAISTQMMHGLGFTAEEDDAEMTEFCRYKERYNHKLMEFDADPEEDIIDWHVTMCGVDTENARHAYPQYRRDQSRILWRVKQLQQHQQRCGNTTATTLDQFFAAVDQAAREDATETLKPPVRYPIETAHSAFMPIVAEYNLEITRASSSSAKKKNDLKMYTQIYMKVLNEAKPWLTEGQIAKFDFDENDTVAIQRVIRDNIVRHGVTRFSNKRKRKLVRTPLLHTNASAIEDEPASKRQRVADQTESQPRGSFTDYTEMMQQTKRYRNFGFSHTAVGNLIRNRPQIEG